MRKPPTRMDARIIVAAFVLGLVAVGPVAGAATSTPHDFPGALARTDAPGATWKDLANPTPLGPEEEANTAGHTLARRYNPAMAFAHDDIWPVPVAYAWHDGARLMARVLAPDGTVVRQFVALNHDRLATADFGDLPNTDPGGNRIEYHVDAPGDDRLVDGISLWRQRWRAIMNADPDVRTGDIRHTRYKPTQYAHLFWFNREKGLLAIQYWFYYPYNEWINHHEGDWEHVNVILRGPSRLRGDGGFRPVGYQFFFHEFVHEPKAVIRVAGHHPHEDHVVIYVGGHSQFYNWEGCQSGGSYPLPASYPAAGGGFGKWRPADDVRKPRRFIAADDFDVVLLPEPDRLDVGLQPELSWLRLNFFAGQTQMHNNPLTLNGVSFGSPPRQPARQETWNAEWTPPYWHGAPQYDPRAVALPVGWQALRDPPQPAAQSRLSARRGTTRPGKARVPLERRAQR